MSNDLRLSNPEGSSIYEALSLKPKNQTPVQEKPEFQSQENLRTDTNLREKPTTGRIPASNFNFDDELPPLMNLSSGSEPQSAGNVNISEGTGENIQTVPLVDLKTNQPIRLKVDKDGQPLTDEKGQFIPDEKTGKMVFVKVNMDTGEPLMKDGKFVLGKPTAGMATVETMQNAMSSHSAERALTGIWLRGFAPRALQTVSKNLLVKGVSVTVPFTGKAVGWGVQHAVAKAVTAEIAKVTAAKVGSTTVVSAAKGAVKPVTEATVKALEVAGHLGKGVQTLTMKEAAGVAGKLINPKNAIELATKVPGVVAKSGAETIAHVSANGVAKTVQKTMIGAGEKVLKEGVEKGIEKGVEVALKRGGKELAETVTTKGVEKAIAKSAEDAAVKAATSGSAKAGSKASSIAPVVGAAIGLAITAWDAKDAYQKTKDPNTTKLSAGLAWATVGLDLVSTVTIATGVGAPIGWVATGLSIGTSVASDYFRYKK